MTHLRLVPKLAVALTTSVLLIGCGSRADPSPGPRPDQGFVSGVVQAGPTCPVETIESPCPPMLVEGAVVELQQDGKVVASGHTNAQGEFRLESPVGQVTVTAKATAGLPSEDSQTVAVEAGKTTAVVLALDTGIR